MSEQDRKQGRSRAPTIVEVATLAGVSKSTVSNVIRGTASVSALTRERVLASIAHLGYRPNVLARQLREQRSGVLGVLIGDFDNPYYAEMARLVEQAAVRAGLTAMFCNIEGQGQRAEVGVQTLLEHRVAGIVFLAFSGRSETVRELLEGVPTISIGLREDWGDWVAVDDVRGGALAARHLLDLGHRRIAYLTSPGVEPRTDRARREGAEQAIAERGAQPLLAVRWQPGEPTARVGRAEVELQALLAGPESVTGVFCSNDLAAIALLDHADRHGLAVPGDLSVVGFDNVSLSALGRISLSTVGQPLDELARAGVETLLDRIAGATGPPAHITPELSLVVRGSTAPPRALTH